MRSLLLFQNKSWHSSSPHPLTPAAPPPPPPPPAGLVRQQHASIAKFSQQAGGRRASWAWGSPFCFAPLAVLTKHSPSPRLPCHYLSRAHGPQWALLEGGEKKKKKKRLQLWRGRCCSIQRPRHGNGAKGPWKHAALLSGQRSQLEVSRRLQCLLNIPNIPFGTTAAQKCSTPLNNFKTLILNLGLAVSPI